MTQTAVSVRLIADAPVALIDHPRAERLGLDQVERDVFGDRRQERRAATDDDRIARAMVNVITVIVGRFGAMSLKPC
jgi:hypothetical protein